MKYALGNMLNGGVMSADGLALDLQFAADKSLVARRGPTPTFTRASSGTFVGSNGLIQSAATNVARFDHDPVTLASRGLLIEESRTNSLVQSGVFGSTAWSRVNVTETLVIAPDGSTTASSFNDGTSNGEHYVGGAFAPSNRPVMGAVACTLSVFIQAGTRRYVLIAASDFSNGVGMVVDTQTWAVSDARSVGTGWTYTSNRLTNFGNGWYRAELTFTPPAATGVIPEIGGINAATITNLNPTYIGTNSTFIAWGAQLEAGSFATSYIPTVASSVVRSADVCSITGAAFSGFYNNTQGTLVSNACSLGVGSAQNPVISIENGTSQVLRIRHLATTNRLGVIVSGVSLIPSSGYDVTGIFYKAAISAGSAGADFVINGVQIPDAYTGSALNADNMKLSVSAAGLSNACIASVRYYQKQLSVSKLQALTA